MDSSEGGDLERVFAICDTDGDGLLSKDELENILKDIGVETGDVNEFMWGLQSTEFITYPQFVYAIEKFRSQNNSGSTLSLHGSRISPRSQAGSAAGGDHTECNCAIHDLNSKNSALSKQVYALEAQIHELVQHTQDQEKNEKLQGKELRKLQGKFSSVSAELEVLKQINKDLTGRESGLKRQMKQMQDLRTSMEIDLQTARTQLASVRSGEDALRDARALDEGIAQETQAEIDRLTDALERSEAEAQQLLRTNEELMRLRREDEIQLKVLDARVERLTLELENKDTLIAELGLVPDRSNPHLDKLGNTWHGFRTVSPLFSELAQADNLTAHPSLVGERNLQIIGKSSLDNDFLMEKVSNVNEEIRSRAPAHKPAYEQKPPPQSDGTGESDIALSSSLSENDRTESNGAEKSDDHDQNDIVTDQLMNLSDLVITTSDIMHDECTTPTYRSRDASTPNAEKSYSSTTPIPASDTTITEYEGDADREGDDERERESEKEGEIESAKEAELPLQSFDTATTPTSSVLGVSPDEAHLHAKEIQTHEQLNGKEQMNGKTPRRHKADASEAATQLQNTFSTPRNLPDPSPRTSNFITPHSYRTPRSTPRRNDDFTTSQSAPTTFRSDDPSSEVTPLKQIKQSKSEVIRTKSEITPTSKKQESTPAKTTPTRRPELVRHKSEVSLYNSDLSRNSSPTGKMIGIVTPDQVNELHEFALRAGLLKPRPLDYVQKADKYAQVDPSELDSQTPRTRSQRSVASASATTPHTAQNTPHSAKTKSARSARTPHTPAQEAHHVDRKIVVRGNSYLVRLLAHPDPALDDLEDTVKKLEAELVAIEERFNKPSSSSLPFSLPPASSTSTTTTSASTSSSSSSSSSTVSTSSTSTTTNTPATPTKGTTPRTPRTPASNHHPAVPTSLANRRTLRPSPLITSTSFKKDSGFKNWKFWLVATLVVVLSILLVAFIVSSKLQASPNIVSSLHEVPKVEL